MNFGSFEYILFLSFVVVVVNGLLPQKAKPTFLLVCSYGFYAYLKPSYLLILLGTTLLDYVIGRKMESASLKSKKTLLAVSLTGNLSVLFLFKYFDFAISSLALTGALDKFFAETPELNLLLPIGISFYTFQTISYSVDIFKGRIPAEKNFVRFALFVSFFPQLVAGPIERAKRILPQLISMKRPGFSEFADGLVLILWGLFLKVIVADNLGLLVTNYLGDYRFSQPEENGLMALYLFFLQLYLDFAAYSIIAIGSGKLLGIDLMKNFDAPLLARNAAEFWQKWHISLSIWFRDYVFYPLYNRLAGSTWATSGSISKSSLTFRHRIFFLIAILVTDILLGFWHGARWGFGAFGLYHALAVTAYYWNQKSWNKMPDFLQLIFSFHLVALSLIFYKAPSLSNSWAWAVEILDFSHVPLFLGFSAVLILADQFYQKTKALVFKVRGSALFQQVAVLGWIYLLGYCLLYYGETGATSSSDFLYFRF